MYGNYAPSGDPDNNTASGSFNIQQLIEVSKGVKLAYHDEQINAIRQAVKKYHLVFQHSRPC